MMNNRKFIFDVDGTLTPSRGRINKHFGSWFSRFCDRQEVYIVTGSDRPKTVQQVGEYIYHQCNKVYQCSGNDVWVKDQNLKTSLIYISDEMQEFFDECLKISNFDIRTGFHIDVRPGLINFSILGRGSTKPDRKTYIEYDKEVCERRMFSEAFNDKFNRLGYECNIAGDTGVDITLMGNGKEQIIQDFSAKDNLIFFGDNTELGGNDYSLANIIPDSYTVKGWGETWEILKEIE